MGLSCKTDAKTCNTSVNYRLIRIGLATIEITESKRKKLNLRAQRCSWIIERLQIALVLRVHTTCCHLKLLLVLIYTKLHSKLWDHIYYYDDVDRNYALHLVCFIIIFFLECQNYQSLTSRDRRNCYTGSLATCDWHTLTPGWYRFQGAAGTKMASACVSVNYCGTPGWLNGAHPTVAEGQVTRQVCFHYFTNCCLWSMNVYARKCSNYFVYYINRMPPEHTCHLRYCGADWPLVEEDLLYDVELVKCKMDNPK